ncbi:MAG: hypothetical protein ACLVJH_14660 [Faecalibacterium prausnitzii]
MFEPQLCRQRAEGRKAQDAYHQKDHRLHPERPGEHAAQQCGGRADGKPDGGHIKGAGLQCQKAHGCSQPENRGDLHGMLPPYAAIIRHPLGEGQEFFTGTLHRKQNIDKNGKERMKWDSKTPKRYFAVPKN